MARSLYGGTSADYATTAAGRLVPGAVFTVWTARTGGSQITDLLDADGVASTVVTASSTGLIYYSGPDGDKEPHWLAPVAGGERTAVVPLDNVGETGATPSLSIGTVTTGTAGATLSGTDEEPVLSLVLPTTGANGVNTAAIQDGAVTSVKIGNGQVQNANLGDGAVTSRVLGTGAVNSAAIEDATIVNGDIATNAAIALSKIAGAYGAKTADYTITAGDSVIAVDTTSGAVTLTLPAASGMTGKPLRIIKTAGANTLTVQRAGSDTILPSNGSRTSFTFPAGCTTGEVMMLSTGSAWYVASGQASDETVGRRLWKWEQALAATSTTASVGFQLVYGDTGWRQISASDLVNGWQVASSRFHLRRVGNRVDLIIYANGSTATAAAFYTAPSGFRPSTTHVGTGVALATKQALLEVAGVTGICSLIFYDTNTFYVATAWLTDNPWPASLPGSAVGSIPTFA